MKQPKIILIILIILCISSACFSESKKEVQAVVDEFPNYIFHLYTLGNIVPADSEYQFLYKDSLSHSDQDYLYQYRNLLGWGDGDRGPLTAFFVFLPGYINLQSQTDINEYFDSLSESLRSGKFDDFIKKYDSYLNKMKLLFGTQDIIAALHSISQYADVVSDVGNIYKSNYQSYHLHVWPKEKVKLIKAAKTINAELQKYDLINHWEKHTGLKFKTGEFQIVLFSANKNGPNANSLGYDRDTFYYNQDIHHMVQFISHEVGTHLLIDDVYQVLQMNRFKYSDVYQAYESMAEFYNVRFIFKGKPLYGYNIDKYYQIYTDLYNANQNINHTDLMIKGLEIYTAQKK